MKVRQGFVSNSSSTSFCIYGVQMEDPELVRSEDLWKRAQDIGLETHTTASSVYIGRAFKNIGEWETGIEFKLTTGKLIEKLLGTPVKCETLERVFS